MSHAILSVGADVLQWKSTIDIAKLLLPTCLLIVIIHQLTRKSKVYDIFPIWATIEIAFVSYAITTNNWASVLM